MRGLEKIKFADGTPKKARAFWGRRSIHREKMIPSASHKSDEESILGKEVIAERSICEKTQ